MDLAALHRLRVHDVNELELIWSSGTQASEIGVALKIPIPDNATNHLSLTDAVRIHTQKAGKYLGLRTTQRLIAVGLSSGRV